MWHRHSPQKVTGESDNASLFGRSPFARFWEVPTGWLAIRLVAPRLVVMLRSARASIFMHVFWAECQARVFWAYNCIRALQYPVLLIQDARDLRFLWYTSCKY